LQNWPSVAISVAVAVISYTASRTTTRRYITSAEREKTRRATERVMTLIESSFIRGQEPASQDVAMWKRAYARECGVPDVERLPSYSQMLEDLDFRMMESSLLTVEQKEKYRSQILRKAEELRSEREKVAVSEALDQLIEKAKASIEANNKSEALSTLDQVKQSAGKSAVRARLEEELTRERENMIKTISAALAALMGVMAMGLTVLPRDYSRDPIFIMLVAVLLAAGMASLVLLRKMLLS